jgi:hypothetical protein
MLRLDCVKNGGKVWVLTKIQKTVRKLYMRNKCYVWQITPAFFKLITLNTQEKYFLSSLRLDYEFLRISGNFFLLGNTFKSCPRQFA